MIVHFWLYILHNAQGEVGGVTIAMHMAASRLDF